MNSLQNCRSIVKLDFPHPQHAPSQEVLMLYWAATAAILKGKKFVFNLTVDHLLS